ncbi:Fc.00g013480.m01.CDS01 [Cosmosporella sp. VM-42]
MKPQLRRHICPARLLSSSAQLLLPRVPAHPSVLKNSQRLITSAVTNQLVLPESPVRPFILKQRLRSCPINLLPGISISNNSCSQRRCFSERGQSTLNPGDNAPLQSNLIYTVAGAAALAGVSFFAYTQSLQGSGTETPDIQEYKEPVEVMSLNVPPGRPETLTPEQEEKLRKLWNSIFQLCGVADDDAAAELLTAKDEGSAETADADAPKKKRFGAFRSKHREGKSGTSTPTNEPEDKYGQTKHFYDTLASETPEAIRGTIWGMVKHDHPDALVLRFLRARKWDVEKALVMLVSTMTWRHSEMHVDDDIMKNGDAFALEDEKTESSTKQVSKDFMDQLRMGKSFLHGTDKNGRPICVVRVRLHKQGEQCEQSLERYTVYIIETARMVLSHPVDTAVSYMYPFAVLRKTTDGFAKCVVFDMTGFSMANMDYTPVKFMIKCFEANYPESLGAVLVHKAPWVFQGIWKIIRGWLDPVVASKVHFTNNKADMEEFIESSHIIKELDGDENWEYKYVAPTPGENEKMKDTVTRDRLLAAREELVKQFEHVTRQWVRNGGGEQSEEIKARRNKLAEQLREDYWNLDPYVRARSLYDRQGAMQFGGKVDWYSLEPPEATPSNGQAMAATSADDVD